METTLFLKVFLDDAFPELQKIIILVIEVFLFLCGNLCSVIPEQDAF